MAGRQKTVAAKKKQSIASQTSQSVEEQTKAFLAAGGVIEQIESGVSGQQNLAGPKQTTTGNKPRTP